MLLIRENTKYFKQTKLQNIMTSIPEYMTAKHRECDDVFSEAETAVAQNNWQLALEKWQCFAQELI